MALKYHFLYCFIKEIMVHCLLAKQEREKEGHKLLIWVIFPLPW